MGVACGTFGENRNAYWSLLAKSERRRPRERLGEYGRIILKWILKLLKGRAWTGFV
jgi:hypothetical protein